MNTSQSGLFDAPAPASPATPVPYTGKIIYETRGKAREYRELSANLYTGCDHGCLYCYAPNVLQRNREVFHTDVRVRTDVLRLLEKDAVGYERAGEKRQILFCFTCDPYSPAIHDTGVTRQALEILKEHDLHFCTLTKGGHRALRDLDLFTPADSFATTLTSWNDAISLHWEPNAALPGARMETLRKFHDAGIPTWVSLEPVLNPDDVILLIRKTAPYVDQYKVGVLNYHPHAKEIDWKDFGFRVMELLEKLGKKYYLKEDLRKAMGM